MTKVVFPAITFPAFKMTRGQLLNVSLFGVGLVIPPWDITFWEAVPLINETVLFDTDDIINTLLAPLAAIPQAVWNLLESTLNKMVEEYYESIEEE